jgi:hypothetical protein
MPVPEAVAQLEHDLRRIFGSRLHSLATYGAVGAADGAPPTLTLAVVDHLTSDDLDGCAASVAGWHASNLATPLLLAAQELTRSLDAFPLEFGTILSTCVIVAGSDPFEGLQVDPMHLRAACEVQARSHLLHLREDYLETEGRGSALAELLAKSAAALATLVTSVARLEGAKAETPEAAARHVEHVLGLADGTLARVVRLAAGGRCSTEEARRTWRPYLDGIERLTQHVDRWVAA